VGARCLGRSAAPSVRQAAAIASESDLSERIAVGAGHVGAKLPASCGHDTDLDLYEHSIVSTRARSRSHKIAMTPALLNALMSHKPKALESARAAAFDSQSRDTPSNTPIAGPDRRPPSD